MTRVLRRTAATTASPQTQHEDETLYDDVDLPGSSGLVHQPSAAAGAPAAAGSSGLGRAGLPDSGDPGLDTEPDASDSDANGAAAGSGDDGTAGSTRCGSRSRSKGPPTAYTRANKNARSQQKRLIRHMSSIVSVIGSKYQQLAADKDSRIINGGQPILGYIYLEPLRKGEVAVGLFGAENLPEAVEALLRDTLSTCALYTQKSAQAEQILEEVGTGVVALVHNSSLEADALAVVRWTVGKDLLASKPVGVRAPLADRISGCQSVCT
jgi:hypothetical protein